MPLIDGGAKTLFNGVSRQPQHVRLPSQVQEGINCVFSVETGGVEKRTGGKSILAAAHPSPGSQTRAWFINRDSTERYAILHTRQGLQINSLVDGTARTLTYTGSALSYLTSDDPQTDYVFTTVADYTFILNKNKVVAADAVNKTPAGTNAAVITVKESVGGWTVTINGGTPVTGSFTSSNTPDVSANQIATALVAAYPTWGVAQVDNFVIIVAPLNAAFTITMTDAGGYTSLVSTGVPITDPTTLPAKAQNGMLVQVESSTSGGTNNASYYLTFEDFGGYTGIWKEAAKPGISAGLDATTMPKQLVRNSDGTFTVQDTTWITRQVGDLTTCPDPPFVGSTISEIGFYRNRITIATVETVGFSAAGDYFNWYPQQTTQVLDSDPFYLTAPAAQVSLMKFLVPFRRTLFAASPRAQYEITTPDVFSPSHTSIDLATTYDLQEEARPVACGDALYMVSQIGPYSILLQYIYDYLYQTASATDVAKHVHGYIPTPIVYTAGDAVTGNIVMMPDLSPAANTDLYLYSYFQQGGQLQQSSFHHWSLNVDAVHGFTIIDGELYVAAQKNGFEYHVIAIPMGRAVANAYPYRPCLDFWVETEGVYNPVTNLTSFIVPYSIASSFTPTDPLLREDMSDFEREDLSGPLMRESATSRMAFLPSSAFGARGIPDVVLVPGDFSHVYAQGDWSGQPMMIGEVYPSTVELSAVFPRNQDGSAMLEGRLQLHQYRLRYENTAYFQVTVIPDGRPAKNFTFDARRISVPTTTAGALPIMSGTYTFKPNTNGATSRVLISNATQMPFTIVATSWVGQYSVVYRKT